MIREDDYTDLAPDFQGQVKQLVVKASPDEVGSVPIDQRFSFARMREPGEIPSAPKDGLLGDMLSENKTSKSRISGCQLHSISVVQFSALLVVSSPTVASRGSEPQQRVAWVSRSLLLYYVCFSVSLLPPILSLLGYVDMYKSSSILCSWDEVPGR